MPGDTPSMGNISMCCPKGTAFSLSWSEIGASILAILVSNRIQILYSRLELDMFLEEAIFSIIIANYKTGLEQGTD